MPDGAAGSTETLGAFRMNKYRKRGEGGRRRHSERKSNPVVRLSSRKKPWPSRRFFGIKKSSGKKACASGRFCRIKKFQVVDLTSKSDELMVLRLRSRLANLNTGGTS